MSNSICEKVSKARKAFRDVVDTRIARFYYIDEKPGEQNRIADRLVIALPIASYSGVHPPGQ